MHISRRLSIWVGLGLSLAAAWLAGCRDAARDEPIPDFNSIAVVPAEGTVTLEGKPLAHAVVSFLPKSGPAAVGETDEGGRYALNYGRDGAPPGDYVVAISYLVSADGSPQGLDARSSLVAPTSLGSASERLPREYSDLGRSRLRAKVPGAGSRALNFDLKGPLLPAPEPSPPSAPTPTPGPGPAAQEPGRGPVAAPAQPAAGTPP